MLGQNQGVVHIAALDQVVGEQVFDFMEEDKGPANTDFMGIVLSRLPGGGLDAQHTGPEIDRNGIGGFVRRFDPDPGTGLFVPDLDGFRQRAVLAFRILLHEGIAAEGLHVETGAAVQDRNLDVVDVDDGVVNSHAGQGGKDMFHGIDVSAGTGKPGTAGRGSDSVRTGGDPCIFTHIDPAEADAGIGRCRFDGHPGNLSGVQSFSFERVGV